MPKAMAKPNPKGKWKGKTKVKKATEETAPKDYKELPRPSPLPHRQGGDQFYNC